MGFFGDMRSIRKIYNRLNIIESLYVQLQRKLCGNCNVPEIKSLAMQINSELKLLASEIEKAPDSAKIANYKFLGHNAPLYEIVKGIYETIQPCLMMI